MATTTVYAWRDAGTSVSIRGAVDQPALVAWHRKQFPAEASAKTRNEHAAVKAFSRWLRNERRAASDPLAGFAVSADAVEPRVRRRVGY